MHGLLCYSALEHSDLSVYWLKESSGPPRSDSELDLRSRSKGSSNRQQQGMLALGGGVRLRAPRGMSWVSWKACSAGLLLC